MLTCVCFLLLFFVQKHSGGKVELAVGRTFERMGFQFDIRKSRKKINLLPAYPLAFLLAYINPLIIYVFYK